MPNRQLGMEKIRQVLRCYSQGYGTKSISSMLTVSRNTVKKYLQVFQRSGLDYEGVLSLSDQELSELFHENTSTYRLFARNNEAVFKYYGK